MSFSGVGQCQGHLPSLVYKSLPLQRYSLYLYNLIFMSQILVFCKNVIECGINILLVHFF